MWHRLLANYNRNAEETELLIEALDKLSYEKSFIH